MTQWSRPCAQTTPTSSPRHARLKPTSLKAAAPTTFPQHHRPPPIDTMPGLTISTDSVSPRTTATPFEAQQAHAQAQTQGQPQAQAPPTAPSTANPLGSAPQSQSRSTSPVRPPISPITPTLPATELPPLPNPQQLPPPASSAASFSAGRQTFTHNQPVPDAAATAIPPPRPEPIDFDANPDVLALKSAISILQLQRQRAANDIRALGAAKDAAAADPEAFLADLTANKIRGQQDPLFPTAQAHDSSSSEDESDDDDEPGAAPSGDVPLTGGSAVDGDPPRQPKTKSKPKSAEPPKPWKNLPRPQNVVRCPPINWAQYAVVGDSLDKLHAEQRARPNQGQPAVVGSDGAFEFKGSTDGNRADFVGVAAPYMPGRDKLENKKPRGGRR
ncbi:hypothetical protein D7B24_005967 [Verticillium nonalfalfae]|uniref:Uncharacterized protein n=1 Tax=Verticillium nonalfalfae TaxID=1051616 RepID=A0A3M9YM28_9PEZI|nr:uncharacterized protein D7B24_005967 [Verticillium nonalfalfae]RNJ60816.1 hypothetical protein D7B24_005967 [Verticillium nonalfalfae]